MNCVSIAEFMSEEAILLARNGLREAKPTLEALLTEVREAYQSSRTSQVSTTLAGERPIVVDSVAFKDYQVALAKNSVKNGRGLEVRIDDNRVGKFDSWGGIREHEFPLTVKTADVKLSNGIQFSSASRSLEVISGWHYAGGGSVWAIKKDIFVENSMTQSTLSGWRRIASMFTGKNLASPVTDVKTQLDWNLIQNLRKGDAVSFEYPFQWDGDKLTNGLLGIPRTRPEGAEWRKLPFGSVPKQGWQPFLDALDGKYLDRLLPLHRNFLKTESPVPSFTPRQKEVKAFFEGKMWQGSEGVERFSTNGNAVIFKAARGDTDNVYVVDNPGVGALYLFKSYEKAADLAVGNVGRLNVRREGAPFVVHSGEWQTRLAKAISKI